MAARSVSADHVILFGGRRAVSICAMIRHIALMALFAGIISSGTAFADDRKDFGTWSFQLENDLFAGTDRHYTNGLRVSWLSPDGDTVEWLALARDALEAIALDDDARPRGDDDRTRGNKQVHFGASLGQDIYTPTDRYRTDVITDDRPYAGWLYGAAALHTITDHGMIDATKAGLKDLESVALQIGVVCAGALVEMSPNLLQFDLLRDPFLSWH